MRWGNRGNVYSIFANGELPFPTVTLSDGKAVKLDQAAYTLYRQSANRADRKKVFDAFWGAFKSYEGTFGANLQAAMLGNVFNAKARKFKTALDASLFADNMPEPVVRTLIAEVNRALPTFHRYLKLRARDAEDQGPGLLRHLCAADLDQRTRTTSTTRSASRWRRWRRSGPNTSTSEGRLSEALDARLSAAGQSDRAPI